MPTEPEPGPPPYVAVTEDWPYQWSPDHEWENLVEDTALRWWNRVCGGDTTATDRVTPESTFDDREPLNDIGYRELRDAVVDYFEIMVTEHIPQAMDEAWNKGAR